ncbi:hypothetical protein MCOR27_010177 [Pyricularia oryzae]|uniref:Rab-GAP TBC domain-containing protein n=1 Tax=Pyricularia grisea TaxID=148305 RepID=A0ABQ8N9K5_PYRGI|nr:hypothetical protein MCOR01_001531 [Pyricularia oryzae]KAI6293506.1 hypothetical protein MCOR33_009087 [Pyricularia grisea]KAI6253893.1 hypothetical protein MCOR19_009572 [Pyricularia oryzae]KAI6268390.1 hypothetical protein MCOR27_010177 [Pyricularia oryzae]KAI6274208.1 hypothetical protein MCOR26_006560 [Pyricularia oryzae]
MRSLEENKTRWQETVKQSKSFDELQRAVKFNAPDSPCEAGCRSVCWKAFLLFQNAPSSSWSHLLLEARNQYSSLREHHLLYIKHPEKLAELTVDPLADDPSSPWDTFRQDETIRAEILQDVRRLPDEPVFYHQEATQTLILDILFLWCKTHPECGGYRQGMHELLAPMVYAVHQDAVDRTAATEALADPTMVEMLDSYFVEHDSFALFSAVMQNAKVFYEVKSDSQSGTSLGSTPAVATTTTSTEQSAIVERSRQVHEVTLMKVDPELSTHLSSVDILPQIFLIRWIRLLFGREFPFEQQLVLWDTMFAFDPNLELIDLICVAMLVRIRWSLLDADYSTALQTLLKYPAPQPPHGPHTFVDDAVYLRDHLNPAGGAALILKYTGRAPAQQTERQQSPSTFASPGGSRSSTPNFGFNSLRASRNSGARSSPSSAARFIQQQANVEALFQGAAKNFIEHGERLGLNQAVRDIRRNVQQSIQEARKAAAVRSAAAASSNAFGISNNGFGNELPSAASLARRNRQLAAMLDEAVAGLRNLAAATAQETSSDSGESSRTAQKDAIEMAAARVQFVQVYLEDSSLILPEEEQPSSNHAGASQGHKDQTLSPPLDVTPDNEPSLSPSTNAVLDAVRDDLRSSPTRSARGRGDTKEVVPSPNPNAIAEEDESADKMDTDDAPPASAITPTEPKSKTAEAQAKPPPSALKERRPPPIPTRSTIAQSSFSWMLEPDVSPSAAAAASAAALATSPKYKTPRSSSTGPFSSSAPPSNRKRMPASRERNAFLFGEVTTPPEDGEEGLSSRRRNGPVTSEEIFGLEPLRKALPPS